MQTATQIANTSCVPVPIPTPGSTSSSASGAWGETESSVSHYDGYTAYHVNGFYIAASGNAPGGPYLNYNQFHETFTDSDPPVLPHAGSGTGAANGSPVSSTNPIPPGGWLTITPTNPSTAASGVASLQVSFKPILAYAAGGEVDFTTIKNLADPPPPQKGFLEQATNAVISAASGLWDWLGEAVSDPKTLASQVGDSIAAPFRGIYNFGADIVNGVIDDFRTLANADKTIEDVRARRAQIYDDIVAGKADYRDLAALNLGALAQGANIGVAMVNVSTMATGIPDALEAGMQFGKAALERGVNVAAEQLEKRAATAAGREAEEAAMTQASRALGNASERGPKVTVPGGLEGTKVYRVWGDRARPNGRSWTPINPGSVPNYRQAAGLPVQNTGRFVSEGIIVDASGIRVQNAIPLHGNPGKRSRILRNWYCAPGGNRLSRWHGPTVHGRRGAGDRGGGDGAAAAADRRTGSGEPASSCGNRWVEKGLPHVVETTVERHRQAAEAEAARRQRAKAKTRRPAGASTARPSPLSAGASRPDLGLRVAGSGSPVAAARRVSHAPAG